MTDEQEESQKGSDFPVFCEISSVLASLGYAIRRIVISSLVHNFSATSRFSLRYDLKTDHIHFHTVLSFCFAISTYPIRHFIPRQVM